MQARQLVNWKSRGGDLESHHPGSYEIGGGAFFAFYLLHLLRLLRFLQLLAVSLPSVGLAHRQTCWWIVHWILTWPVVHSQSQNSSAFARVFDVGAYGDDPPHRWIQSNPRRPSKRESLLWRFLHSPDRS